VNPAFARMAGYTVEDLMALTWDRVQALVHPDDRAMVWGRFRDRAAGKEVVPQYEFRLLHKDGSTRWLELFASTMSYRGQPAIQAAMIDVTERRQAVQALRESEAFLRNVIDTVPSMIFVKDRAGRFVLGNTALYRCYGTDADGMLGRTDADFNPKAHEVEHFQRDDSEVIDSRREKQIPEEEVTHADGQVRWFSTVKVPLLNQDGSCDKVLGVASDITERKRAELALRQSEERFRLALDIASEGFVLSRLNDGCVLDINDGFTAITGYAREQAVGRTAAELNYWVDPADRARFAQTLRDSGHCRDFEATFRRLDGSLARGRISARLVRSEGEPCVLACFQDITEQTSLENRLAELRAALESARADAESASLDAERARSVAETARVELAALRERQDPPPPG
jgi:PAS domain S-box-containing protein